MKKVILTILYLIAVLPAFGGDFFVESGYIVADEDNTDGDGIYAEFGYMITSGNHVNHCIEVELGKLDMGYKEEDLYLEAINNRYGTNFNELPSYDIMPYLLAYKCIFPLIERVHGYAKVGGGIVRAEILGESDTATAFQVGAGVELMANDSFGIHLEYDYMKMDDLSDTVDGQEYTLSVGDIGIYRIGCICYF